MVGVDWFATKTEKHNRETFFGNKFNNKKTIFVLFVDHGQKLMGQNNKKKAVTDVNYIPRTEKFRKTI